MAEKIEELEQKRKKLYQKLSKIGDFRRGNISVNFRKCGKKNCTCTQQDNPGHGPYYLWNTTLKGKSYAKHLPLGPELDKYTKEIENYQKFKELMDEIIQVNEQISELKPVHWLKDENELEKMKKKLHMQFQRKLREKSIRSS